MNATNFDATAGTQILPNNCIFPKLIVQIIPYWKSTDTLSFVNSNIYSLNGNDSFKILNFQMYLSGINVLDGNKKVLKITDSLLVYRANDSFNVAQNILLNNNTTFSYTQFTLNYLGSVTGFQFDTGLDAVAQKAVPIRNPNASPLSVQSVSMYDTLSTQYYFQKITLVRYGTVNDTIPLQGYQSIPFNFSLSNNLVKGFSYIVSLDVNYFDLFKNVDIKTEKTLLANQIWANLRSAITLSTKRK